MSAILMSEIFFQEMYLLLMGQQQYFIWFLFTKCGK